MTDLYGRSGVAGKKHLVLDELISEIDFGQLFMGYVHSEKQTDTPHRGWIVETRGIGKSEAEKGREDDQ